jgi:D-alanyl-D-alanine carboxypeptidase/D-alanyl-D-alanine-endopeptidase (penicillin-binding protein 4)
MRYVGIAAAVFCAVGCQHEARELRVEERIARARTLPEKLDALLAPIEAGGDVVGAYVIDAGTGKTIYARHEHTRSLPASTLKLATTAAALAAMGADYRFRTPVYLQGSLDGKSFTGDIVVGATGDPSFGSARFTMTSGVCDRIAEAMAKRGISQWSGSVRVYDAIGGGEVGLGPGWAWDDAAYDYSAAPLPFVFRENAARLMVVRNPDERCSPDFNTVFEGWTGGYTADIRDDVESPDDGLDCRRRSGSREFQCVWHHNADVCPHSVTARLSLIDPVAAFHSCLDKAMTEAGIQLESAESHRRRHEVDPPVSAAKPDLLLEVASPTMGELIRATNKESLNIYAERIGLQAARYVTGSGTYEGLREAVDEDHKARGIEPQELVQVDGSGLSRYNLVTASAMVRILYTSLEAPYGQKLLASLPIAGVDGTLSQHVLPPEVRGHVRAKTGTLSGQRAFVGMVDRPNDPEHPNLLFALLLGNMARPTGTTNSTFDRLSEILVAAPVK